MTRIEYILKYAPYVMEALKRTRLFPSVMMAQALLESASNQGVPGGSLLASKYNNHFGIKADSSWTGEKIELSTTEFVKGAIQRMKACFRVYDNAHESFDDRIKFLLTNARYTYAGVFSALNAEEQVKGLQRAGYATDPNYADKLYKLIRKLRLEKLDQLASVPSDLSALIFSNNKTWSSGT